MNRPSVIQAKENEVTIETDRPDSQSWQEALQACFAQQIPLSRAMQVCVQRADDAGLTLAVPLAANVNPHGTAFGGSLYSAALLAGWGQIFLQLQRESRQGEIVIAQASMQYLAPVTGDFLAHCDPLDNAQWQRYCRLRRGRLRLHLNPRILCQGEVCASLTAVFAVSATP